MASEFDRAFCRGARRFGLVVVAWTGATASYAQQPAAKPPIYSCEVGGKRFTSDRPLPECTGRDQRILNPDGSPKGILPPPLTVEERERKEAQDREAEITEQRRKQWVRADRNLMQLYPNEEAHSAARRKALADLDLSVQKLNQRIELLKKDRKPLLDEAEFYPDGKLPPKVKNALDANEASLTAQRNLVQNQTSEVARINATYDIELARLRKLWGGAQAGSMGPLPGPGPQTPSQPAVAVKAPDASAKTTTK